MTRGHAEALMPLLKRVMDQAGMRIYRHRPRRRDYRTRQLYRLARRPCGRAWHCSGGRQTGRGRYRRFRSLPLRTWQATTVFRSLPPSTRGTAHVYLQVFSAGGRTFSTPRLASLSEAAAAAGEAPACIVGTAAQFVADALTNGAAPTGHRGPAAGPRYRLGCTDGRCRAGRAIAAGAAISARRRRATAIRGPTAAPMMNFVARLFTRAEPTDLGGEARTTPPPLPPCMPLRSGAAGARMSFAGCLPTATLSPIAP